MLKQIYKALKTTTGRIILKEPILDKEEKTPRLCPSGQWMIVRPLQELEKWIKLNFVIISFKDV